MMKKMLTDRRGVAIEMAILMTVICFAVSSIVLSTALLQYEKKVRAEERLAESVILEQMVEQWMKDTNSNVAGYVGYYGVAGTSANKLTLDIYKTDENQTPIQEQKVLTIEVDQTSGKITGWKKG